MRIRNTKSLVLSLIEKQQQTPVTANASATSPAFEVYCPGNVCSPLSETDAVPFHNNIPQEYEHLTTVLF